MNSNIKVYSSGSKPRYDGSGSLFGDLHRHLPKSNCMFDIDRMMINVEAWLKRENEGFVEYKHNGNEIEFKALFEIKHRYINAAFDSTLSVNKARAKMCELLGCRLFVVVLNEGLPPLNFYEYCFISKEFSHKYSLSYCDDDKDVKTNECFSILGLR